jgi:hypothetical protein
VLIFTYNHKWITNKMLIFTYNHKCITNKVLIYTYNHKCITNKVLIFTYNHKCITNKVCQGDSILRGDVRYNFTMVLPVSSINKNECHMNNWYIIEKGVKLCVVFLFFWRCAFLSIRGSSWSCSYDSWIYNYLCNQCQSPLTL